MATPRCRPSSAGSNFGGSTPPSACRRTSRAEARPSNASEPQDSPAPVANRLRPTQQPWSRPEIEEIAVFGELPWGFRTRLSGCGAGPQVLPSVL
eukprot:4924870-Amphidinium_carterae.1